MTRKTILVVEDDEDIQRLITLYLQKDYDVITSANGIEALQLVEEHSPHLVILDILLPGMNGFEVCQKLREEDKNTPVLCVSAKREADDKICGLERGADDYLTKPFDPGELVARVKALLRRSYVTKVQQSASSNRSLQFGDLHIDTIGYTVTRAGQNIHLYAKEMQVLLLLSQNPNQVFSVEHIYDSIWGLENDSDVKVVSVHVSSLRKKIEKNPSKPQYIVTVRGFGYKFIQNV
ncbi:response regulator transcription factor [Bacillus piscicola]|uniref:response regulator transcription factor n=1 Tax=Bacillus piscicola TaxID=1632684 RepID=UPI001F0982C9|nr:response regulator transcription factor [Bacillus piscicola]